MLETEIKKKFEDLSNEELVGETIWIASMFDDATVAYVQKAHVMSVGEVQHRKILSLNIFHIYGMYNKLKKIHYKIENEPEIYIQIEPDGKYYSNSNFSKDIFRPFLTEDEAYEHINTLIDEHAIEEKNRLEEIKNENKILHK